MNSPVKIILDTNLWVSYLISSRLLNFDLLLEQKKVRLIFSRESLQEFIEVANRPKFKKYFSEEDINELLDLFGYYGELIEVIDLVEVCRDPKDNFLLALAKSSQAHYLITGDNDLLALKQFESTLIITYAEFEKLTA